MSHPELGQLIHGLDKASRDAVHVAVAPVRAYVDLNPGQRIALRYSDSDVAEPAGAKSIGIVDPFLKDPVTKGQSFWMFLDPGTVSDLSHHWTHPAFADDEPYQESEESDDGCRGC